MGGRGSDVIIAGGGPGAADPNAAPPGEQPVIAQLKGSHLDMRHNGKEWQMHSQYYVQENRLEGYQHRLVTFTKGGVVDKVMYRNADGSWRQATEHETSRVRIAHEQRLRTEIDRAHREMTTHRDAAIKAGRKTDAGKEHDRKASAAADKLKSLDTWHQSQRSINNEHKLNRTIKGEDRNGKVRQFRLGQTVKDEKTGKTVDRQVAAIRQERRISREGRRVNKNGKKEEPVRRRSTKSRDAAKAKAARDKSPEKTPTTPREPRPRGRPRKDNKPAGTAENSRTQAKGNTARQRAQQREAAATKARVDRARKDARNEKDRERRASARKQLSSGFKTKTYGQFKVTGNLKQDKATFRKIESQMYTGERTQSHVDAANAIEQHYGIVVTDKWI